MVTVYSPPVKDVMRREEEIHMGVCLFGTGRGIMIMIYVAIKF